MQIKYLKDAPQAQKGDIREVANLQANILIKRGFAKEHKTRSKKTPSAPTNDDTDESE